MTDYHVDPAGNDLNDGLSPATAWKAWTKAAAGTYPAGSRILLKAGSQFTGSMLVPANVNVDIYGGSAKAVFSNLRDIKGVASDWTQEPTNPKAWSRTIPSTNTYDWVVYDGGARWNGWVSPISRINAPGLYSRPGMTRVTVYSVDNPASTYSTLENTLGAGTGLSFKSAGGTVRNIIFKGHGSGIKLINNHRAEDCEVWFSIFQHLIIGGHNNVADRSPGYFTGIGGNGNHGIYVSIPRVGTTPILAINYVIDSPNYGAGEDNFQQNIGGNKGEIAGDVIETHLVATSPKSMWLWRSPENAIDVKVGTVFLEGPGMASCDASQQATVTTQGHSHGVVNRGWSLRHAGSEAAIQFAEYNDNKFDSKKSFYYSEWDVAWWSIYNGQAHKSERDIFWAPNNFAAGMSTGGLSSKHSTFISNYGGFEALIGGFSVAQSASTFGSITHDGIDDGQGNYTATLAEKNINGSQFGNGAGMGIAGLTGPSAAYNGIYTVSANNFSGGKCTFKVKISLNPPTPAVLTGLVVSRVSTIGTFNNNLMIGGRSLYIGGADCLPTAIGANALSGAFPGFYNGKWYTTAQVISDVAAAGNLKFDTGGKAGGPTWRAETAQSLIFEPGTISITNKIATVTSALVPQVGQPVGIIGTTNTNLHGAHFVKSVGAGFFTFDANYDEPDAPANPCSVTQWRVKPTSAAYQSAPPL